MGKSTINGHFQQLCQFTRGYIEKFSKHQPATVDVKPEHPNWLSVASTQTLSSPSRCTSPLAAQVGEITSIPRNTQGQYSPNFNDNHESWFFPSQKNVPKHPYLLQIQCKRTMYIYSMYSNNADEYNIYTVMIYIYNIYIYIYLYM